MIINHILMVSWGSKVGTWDSMWTGPHSVHGYDGIWQVWIWDDAASHSLIFDSVAGSLTPVPNSPNILRYLRYDLTPSSNSVHKCLSYTFLAMFILPQVSTQVAEFRLLKWIVLSYPSELKDWRLTGNSWVALDNLASNGGCEEISHHQYLLAELKSILHFCPMSGPGYTRHSKVGCRGPVTWWETSITFPPPLFLRVKMRLRHNWVK